MAQDTPLATKWQTFAGTGSGGSEAVAGRATRRSDQRVSVGDFSADDFCALATNGPSSRGGNGVGINSVARSCTRWPWQGGHHRGGVRFTCFTNIPHPKSAGLVEWT